MFRPTSPVAPLSAFPLPLAEFWSSFRFPAFTPALTGDAISNSTEAGDTIVAQRGARLWRWQVTVAPMFSEDLAILSGRIEDLAAGIGSFLATPPFGAYPAADPTGAILGAAAPVIASLPAGGRTLTLSGLPAGYVLRAGDWLSFTRDTPARYELHRLVTGGTANGSGVTPALQVVPPLRPGVVVGAAVTLKQPVMRATILPGSLRAAPVTPGTSQGLAFDVQQTLRKAG